jgi:hypothetical protein
LTQPAIRHADLTPIPSARTREMQYQFESRGNVWHGHGPIEVRDDLDQSDADFQRDLELAVLQMKVQRR